MEIERDTPYRLNHNDISFDFLNREFIENISIYNKHLVVLVYAGELLIQEGKQQMSLKRGDCIFIRSNSRIILIKKSVHNETFRGIALGLGYNFLKGFYYNVLCNRITHFMDFDKNIIKLSVNVYMESLYVSLKPYLHENKKPDPHVLVVKLQEAVYCLLTEKVGLYAGILNPLCLPGNQDKLYLN